MKHSVPQQVQKYIEQKVVKRLYILLEKKLEMRLWILNDKISVEALTIFECSGNFLIHYHQFLNI